MAEIWPLIGETRTSLTMMEDKSGLPYRFVMPGPTISIAEADAILLGAVGAAPGGKTVPSGLLERGLLLKLRFAFDHYVNLRPSRLYPGVPTPLADSVVAGKEVDFVVVREGESLVIGRDADCGLEVDDSRVSRRHAELRWTGEGWVLEDLESKNGTNHNGESACAREVRDRDEISFGGLPATVAHITDEQAAALAHESESQAESAELARRRNG